MQPSYVANAKKRLTPLAGGIHICLLASSSFARTTFILKLLTVALLQQIKLKKYAYYAI